MSETQLVIRYICNNNYHNSLCVVCVSIQFHFRIHSDTITCVLSFQDNNQNCMCTLHPNLGLDSVCGMCVCLSLSNKDDDVLS